MRKKKKYKKSYTTGGRVDMRKGGRVGYAVGDRVLNRRPIQAEPQEVQQKLVAQTRQPAPSPAPVRQPTPAPAPQPAPQPSGLTPAQIAEQKRSEQSRIAQQRANEARIAQQRANEVRIAQQKANEARIAEEARLEQQRAAEAAIVAQRRAEEAARQQAEAERQRNAQKRETTMAKTTTDRETGRALASTQDVNVPQTTTPQPQFGIPNVLSQGDIQPLRNDRDVINDRDEQEEVELNEYGIPKSVWDNMTDEQRQAVIDQYNANNDGDAGDAGDAGDGGNAGDADNAGDITEAERIRALSQTEQESEFQQERSARMIETGKQAQDIAQGILPDNIPVIPDPAKISRKGTEITPEQAANLQMKATREAQAATVGAVSPEQVATISDVSKADAPDPFEAATIKDEDIAKVSEDVVVEAASGSVSPEVSETLAKAAGVQAVAPIEAARVEVVPGAVQERVVGVISPEAKAQAAKVAGTTLARVTRAKKQLRNAGLSEADIQELGNDPEALEVRLTDFTEEQRGIVEGLPEEALVSNQIDSLLSGIENGEVPTWASPAVAAVEEMLAQRGLSASTVGRDALLNAIITSALPIAQSNAQAIQNSVAQQKSIEATAALKNAEMAQQTALFNAQNVFQMDMAQFSADQQRAINNAKFFQTTSIQNASMEQQGIVQDAVLMSQRNLAEADQNTKFAIQNAQAFLAMDMANLNNQQQSNVLKAQQLQQRLLSNQAAENAAAQFNATSEQQTNQFMASLNTQISQFNAQQTNALSQFNTTQKNAAEARRVANEFEARKLDAQMATDIDKFNAAQAAAREQFNVTNATAIAQSNVAWRRQANTADTAAINAVNQQNAQNAFGLSASAQNFLWQELRDEADYIFKRWDNDEQRKASLMIAALGNEGATAKDSNWSSNLTAITKLVEGWLD